MPNVTVKSVKTGKTVNTVNIVKIVKTVITVKSVKTVLIESDLLIRFNIWCLVLALSLFTCISRMS